MSDAITKAGIISCSGESIPEGTIARLATRHVLETLRPGKAVTICLPLFLAGEEGERDFAKTHPTIAVDGCEKQCAKYGTEKHSGPISGALIVTEILGTKSAGCSRSSRRRSEADSEAVLAVAGKIADEIDRVIAESNRAKGL